MKFNDFLKLIFAVAIAETAGLVGSVFTRPAITSWYLGLTKPALNPPNWIFGPVWTTLYFLMGVAAFLVWRRGLKQKEVKTALVVFSIQLVLNTLWSIIFFGWHNPFWSFVEIIILWFAILGTIFAFYKISRPAAYLLLPYIFWVSFAVYLNYFIWALN